MFQRPMEFAGSWYPAQAAACEREIRGYWERPVVETAAQDDPARWGVVPHAGWIYSGRLAARVFQLLAEEPPVELVIVLGGHLRAADAIVAMTEGQWKTPFGAMPVHGGFREALAELPAVVFEDEHRSVPDNSTELQLPFAHFKYPRAELLPLRVPPGPIALQLGRKLADYLERSGLNAVAVASTDLTHYGPGYRFEPQGRGPAALRWVSEENDPAFIDAVASGDGERMLATAANRHNACSAGAVAALNEVALRHGQRFEPLQYATSQDAKAGDALNFVGYVGGVFR